jgi:hypothetical protein
VTRRNHLTAVVAVLACGAALAACGSSSSSSSSSSDSSTGNSAVSSTPPPPTSPGSKVAFVTPHNGATMGSTVTAKVKLTHFRIDPKAVGQAPRPGVGHLHFVLDGGKYDFVKYSGPNGKIGKQLGVNGKYSPALAPTITYAHLPAGKHQLGVILANNNHTSTGVTAGVSFTVR